MKNHKIFLLLIASIVLLAGCEANNADDTSASAADAQTHAEVDVSEYAFTTAETINLAEKDATLETNPTTEANTAITTETTSDTTRSETVTEIETTLAQTSSEFSETTTETVTEATTTAMVKEKSGFYFEPEDGYAERFVDDLTGDPELFEHFSDALFIYREFYSGIDMTPSKVFKNHGNVDSSTGLVSTGVAYSDYEEYLGLYFTDNFIEELSKKDFIVNIDGEVYYNDWFLGARGSDIFFVGGELTITEKTNEQMTLTLTSYFSGKEIGDDSFEDKIEVYDIIVIKTDGGWRFDNMNSIC